MIKYENSYLKNINNFINKLKYKYVTIQNHKSFDEIIHKLSCQLN